MHNALSNSITRKLKLFCEFHFSLRSTIHIFPLKDNENSTSVIHNLLPMLLCCSLLL